MSKMEKGIKPGMICRCAGTGLWKQDFIGIIHKVFEHSVMVIIMVTDQDDDHLIDKLKGKTVISKKNIYEMTEEPLS